MPLYKFECETCHHKFEQMVAKEGDAVKCPKCGSAQCKKLVGSFSTASGSGSSCSVNKRRG